MTHEQYNFICAMIELIDDLPVGCEALEDYVESNNLHEDWIKFKTSFVKK